MCFCFVLSGGLDNSVILAGDTSNIAQLNTWLLPKLQNSDTSYWALCWRASSHGWASSTFHSYCDGDGPTVTIVSVHGPYIFGGYNDNSWACKSVNNLILLYGDLTIVRITFLWRARGTESVTIDSTCSCDSSGNSVTAHLTTRTNNKREENNLFLEQLTWEEKESSSAL